MAVDLGMERAILGEEVPVMYRGRRVGTRQVHDNRLLIAVLNAIGPIAPEPSLRDDPNLVFRQAGLERQAQARRNSAISLSRSNVGCLPSVKQWIADCTCAGVRPSCAITERAAAIAGVVATRDDMYRHPLRLGSSAAYAGHAYGVPATGTEESLPKITGDAVSRWHRDKVVKGKDNVTDAQIEAVASYMQGVQ